MIYRLRLHPALALLACASFASALAAEAPPAASRFKPQPGFSVQERWSDATFQTRDATWCSPENPTIHELGGAGNEHHRCDRAFLPLASATMASATNLADVILRIVRETWSDHYGLECLLPVP